MIYVQEGYDSDSDDLPPMGGTRIKHEVVDEDVMLVRIQYGPPNGSFRSGRREEVIVTPLGEHDDETEGKCLDWLHKTAGTRPLVSR